jgi:hypothetical protein
MRAAFALLLAGGLGAAAGGAAWAQRGQEVLQISDPSAQSVLVDPVPGEAAAAAPPAQISAPADSSAREQQLTTGPASHQPPSQVAKGQRTAEPSQPLSLPADGRTAAVDRVQGKDRCDPATPAAKRSPECSQVIEARADEYSRPEPTELSPEQKLLLREEREGAGEDVADATKRLATSGETSDSLTAMGIASIVLDQQQQQRKEQKPGDADAEAATQAMVNFLSLTPPR